MSMADIFYDVSEAELARTKVLEGARYNLEGSRCQLECCMLAFANAWLERDAFFGSMLEEPSVETAASELARMSENVAIAKDELRKAYAQYSVCVSEHRKACGL